MLTCWVTNRKKKSTYYVAPSCDKTWRIKIKVAWQIRKINLPNTNNFSFLFSSFFPLPPNPEIREAEEEAQLCAFSDALSKSHLLFQPEIRFYPILYSSREHSFFLFSYGTHSFFISHLVAFFSLTSLMDNWGTLNCTKLQSRLSDQF